MHTITDTIKTGQIINYKIIDTPERISEFTASVQKYTIRNRNKIKTFAADNTAIQLQADYYANQVYKSEAKNVYFYVSTKRDSLEFKELTLKAILDLNCWYINPMNTQNWINEAVKLLSSEGYNFIDYEA